MHQFKTSMDEKTNAKHTEIPSKVYKGTFAPEDKCTQFSSSTKHRIPETMTSDANVTKSGFRAGWPIAGPPANILQKMMPPINKNNVPKYTEKKEFNEISTKVQFTIHDTATPNMAPKMAAIPDLTMEDMTVFWHYIWWIIVSVISVLVAKTGRRGVASSFSPLPYAAASSLIVKLGSRREKKSDNNII